MSHLVINVLGGIKGILKRRKKIKAETIKQRKRLNQKMALIKGIIMGMMRCCSLEIQRVCPKPFDDVHTITPKFARKSAERF